MMVRRACGIAQAAGSDRQAPARARRWVTTERGDERNAARVDGLAAWTVDGA